MNKQEALEAMLAACREYETPDGMRSEPTRQKAVKNLEGVVFQAVEADLNGYEGQARQSLVKAGGMILAMLVDEEG